MELSDATAVVTGGASGLGAATARHLATLGSRVVIVDRDLDQGELAADEIGAKFIQADVTDEPSISAAMRAAASDSCPMRLLVNCAGGGPAPRPMLGTDGTVHDLSAWDRTLSLNVTGTFNATRFAVPQMCEPTSNPDRTEPRGLVVTVSSVAAFQGPPDLVAYATAKSAICGFTVAAAHSYASVGVRVVGIVPGTFRTPALEAYAENNTLDVTACLPRRLGEPSEFAQLVEHIARNDYLNAQTIRLDGGGMDGF